MTNTAQPLLEVTDLNVVTTESPPRYILKDISLSVSPGEMLGVIGEGGAGKTVLGLAMLRILPPSLEMEGSSVYFDGRDLLPKSEKEMRTIRGKELAMVVAGGRTALNPMETVETQIGNVIKSHMDVDKQTRYKMTINILKAVGINDPERRIHSYPHELSGGMAQRVLAAQALVCSPKVLIADEPTSDLDVTIAAQVLDQMKSLIDEKHAATIMLTRDLGIIAQYCDRAAVLHKGEVVEYAPVTTLFKDARHEYTQTLLQAAVAARSQRETETGKMIQAGARSTSAEEPAQKAAANSFKVANGLLASPEYVRVSECHFVRRGSPVGHTSGI